jgi:uracil-DNA glycosylase
LEQNTTPSEESESAPTGPRHELARLVRSLRAHVEELDASGAWGIPRAASTRPPEVALDASREVVHGAPRPGESNAARPAPSATAGAGAGAAEARHPAPALSGGDARASEPIRLPRATGETLEAIAAEARVCTNCALHEGRHHSVFSRGTGASGVVFVGEGPGEEEDRQGLPFVGPAGQLLDRMILAMQLGRDDVYVCNIVKCRPPKNRKPEADEMARCMPFLDRQLSLLEPRVIVALGATAVQGLLGTTEGITRLRGQWKLYRGKIPVMPTFHPAYLLRTPQAKRDVWKDLQEVLRRLREEAPPSA